MGIMDDIKFDINVELYGADTANRKYAVQVEQERAEKVDSQKHSVPRKFLKGVAAMPEKMLKQIIFLMPIFTQVQRNPCFLS